MPLTLSLIPYIHCMLMTVAIVTMGSRLAGNLIAPHQKQYKLSTGFSPFLIQAKGISGLQEINSCCLPECCKITLILTLGCLLVLIILFFHTRMLCDKMCFIWVKIMLLYFDVWHVSDLRVNISAVWGHQQLVNFGSNYSGIHKQSCHWPVPTKECQFGFEQLLLGVSIE